jgi:HK97 family phage portal protein
MFWTRWFGKSRTIAAEGAVTTFGDGQPYRPDISMKALVRRNTSWVYAMIDTNAKAVAQSTLRLFVAKPTNTSKSRFRTRSVPHHRKQYLLHKSNLLKFTTPAADVEEVLEHPLIDLINRVNGIQNRFDLFYLTASAKDATGNAYWLKCRNGLAVNELWPLQPQFVWARADKKKFISHYEYGRSSEKIKIPVKDMVHFRYPSINQPFLGVGPLEAAVVAADLYMSMNTYETAMFRKGGNPDTVLTYPKDVVINEDEKKRVRHDFRRFQKPSNAGKFAIATGGAEFKPFSLSPKEMAFLKGRDWSLKELAGIFGVPMSFLQDEGVSRANADVAERGYMRRTILPRLTMNEETMNQDLAPEFDENLFFAYDNPVPEDKEFRLQEQKTHIETKYASINEEREIDGKDPVAWGDAPPEPPEIVAPGPNETDKAICCAHAKAKFPALETPSANFIPTEFVAALVSYFERMGEDVSAQAAKAEFKRAKASADDLVPGWFKMDLWDERLKNVFLPFVRATFLQAGQRAIETIDTTASFNDGAALGIVEKRTGAIRQINRTTQKIVRQAVADGILAGEGAEPIQRRIRAVFSAQDIGRKRALLIARTETIWAFNQGAIEAYKQSGVVKEVEWITAADERVCEWCGPMDGRIQTLGFNFFDQGTEFEGDQGGTLSFNFEPIEHPPLHPQCRCSIAGLT